MFKKNSEPKSGSKQEKLPVFSAYRYQCDGPDGCLSRSPFPASHKCKSEQERGQ